MKFLPTFSDNLIRYCFALEYCKRRRVLDLGSNDGHGTHILSYGASSITAADIDPIFMAKAKKYYRYFCPVDFVLANFDTDFPKGEWDVVVCTEVIEHVDNPDLLVKNINEHLAPGGKLVFSVPHMVANRLHKTLFDKESITALINKHMNLEELYEENTKVFSGKERYKGLKGYVGVASKK